jgi:hypothetical protein
MIKSEDKATIPVEKEEIRKIIMQELEKIRDHKTHLGQGCAACHVIFTLKNTLDSPEQDCADMVSQILTEDPQAK